MRTKLTLKISPDEFAGMLSVLARKVEDWQAIGLPGWQLPQTADFVLLGFAQKLYTSSQADTWSQKNPARLYTYTLRLYEARALWDELHANGAEYVQEQAFFDRLTLALVNGGWVKLAPRKAKQKPLPGLLTRV